MNICVISPSYPTHEENSYQFVANLCNTLAEKGHNVFVIVPQSKTNQLLRNKKKIPYKQISYIGIQGKVTVYAPAYLSFGNVTPFSNKLNLSEIRRAIRKAVLDIDCHIDVIYGHFWRSGLNAYSIAKELSIPLFVATGESTIFVEDKDPKLIKDFSDYVSGVICVSTKNKKESINLGLTTEDKCIILPNAYDDSVFFKRNRSELRNKLGIKDDLFVAIFVGHFIERKGPKRVSEAIKELNNPCIKGIYVGKVVESKSDEPEDDNFTIFKGSIQNKLLPEYLNCADVFVLPTLHEGCCNAIIEAVACGLPIISSDRDFNYDVLDDKNSILIDPTSISDISNAILKLFNDKDLRERLSKESLIRAKELTLNNRTDRIIDFIMAKSER